MQKQVKMRHLGQGGFSSNVTSVLTGRGEETERDQRETQGGNAV